MSLDSVLEILEERGLSLSLGEDGKPKIKGKKEQITDAVRDVLSVYRDEIIDRLKPPPRREFLWTGTGYTEIDKLNMPADWYPVGAWYWRRESETDADWKLIPGVRDVQSTEDRKQEVHGAICRGPYSQ